MLPPPPTVHNYKTQIINDISNIDRNDYIDDNGGLNHRKKHSMKNYSVILIKLKMFTATRVNACPGMMSLFEIIIVNQAGQLH